MFHHSRVFSKILSLFVLLSLLLGSAIFPGPVLADSTITVNTSDDELNADGDCSLREAIQAANDDAAVDACTAGSDIDTISIPAGTYTLTIDGTEEDGNQTGDLDIVTSLNINGADAGTTTIRAGATSESGIDRVFNMFGATSIVSISDVTIANGYTELDSGAAIYNDDSTLTITNSTFLDNYADGLGGSIYNGTGTLTVINSTFSDSVAFLQGGGIYNDAGTLTITNSTFSDNSAYCGGGIYNFEGTVDITGSTFSDNFVECIGGGIYNLGTMTVTNSTFSDNFALNEGGGIANDNDLTVSNSTFSGNAAGAGGGIYNFQSDLTVINSTFSENAAEYGGGIYNYESTLHLQNTILANSISDEDCYNDLGTIATNSNNLIETNGADEYECGTPALTADPSLGVLIGSPAYFLLNNGSPAINAGNDAICAAAPVNNTSQGGVTRPIGAHCDIGSYEAGAEINVTIGETIQGSHILGSGENQRASYAGLNNGPVKVEKTNLLPIIASERVAYTPDGGTTWTSFDEMMGLPSNQLTDTYYFPYYNNVEMNTQLRFGNVGTSNTDVTVTIAGVVQGVYAVAPNQSMRLSYILNSGPVKVQSSGSVPIIASIRFANIESTSPLVVPAFTEMMGLPGNQLTTTYIFPHYNNVEMNTQLRFGNVGTSATNVTVTIGGVVQGVYPVAPSQSVRLFYNLNSGPVKVQSSGGVPIIASMRFANIESESPLVISYFSEMLGLPQASLSTNYWFPIYDNVTHNMQLRFGNMGTTSTTVTVRVGGVEQGSYVVLPNQSQRLFYTLNDGPVQVQSSGGVPIIASIRFAFIESESPLVVGAFSEMLGLPASQLSSTYLFPWYNNDELDTQMRIAVP